MPPIYNPFDWYWKKLDGSAYHSRREREVPADDPEYLAWLAEGHVPYQYPMDNYGKENRDWMLTILKPWGLRIYPLIEAEEYELHQRKYYHEGSGPYMVDLPSMDVPEDMNDREAVERYMRHLRGRQVRRQSD